MGLLDKDPDKLREQALAEALLGSAIVEDEPVTFGAVSFEDNPAPVALPRPVVRRPSPQQPQLTPASARDMTNAAFDAAGWARSASQQPPSPQLGPPPSPGMLLGPPPQRPQPSRQPSINDPPPQAMAEWENAMREYQARAAAQQQPPPVQWANREFDALPSPQQGPSPQQMQAPVKQPMAAPDEMDGFGSEALANAIRRQRQGDTVSQVLGGLTQAVTGSNQAPSLPGSTALEDFVTQRDASLADRNRRLLEARQGRGDAMAEEQHGARMRQLGQQFEESEADGALKERLRDPNSDESERARQTYLALGDELGIEGIDRMIEGQSANELRENPEFQRIIDYASQKGLIGERGQFTRFGRRTAAGFGGGGGGGARTDDLRQDVLQNLIDGGLSEEQANRAVARVSRRRLEQMQASTTAALLGARTGVQREERRDEQEERRHRPGVGFARRDDAPELTTTELRSARELPATRENLGAAIRGIMSVAKELNAAEAGAARAGILNDRLARAKALHEEVTIALRNIGNYGVPQAAELERMESLAPRLDSFQGFMSALQQYRALWQGMNRQLVNKMQSYGYDLQRNSE